MNKCPFTLAVCILIFVNACFAADETPSPVPTTTPAPRIIPTNPEAVRQAQETIQKVKQQRDVEKARAVKAAELSGRKSSMEAARAARSTQTNNAVELARARKAGEDATKAAAAAQRIAAGATVSPTPTPIATSTPAKDRPPSN